MTGKAGVIGRRTLLVGGGVLGALGGCAPKVQTMAPIERATRVTLRTSGPDAGNQAAYGVVGEIIDPARIAALLAFVNARLGGWSKPWYGFPVPEVKAEIRDGSALVAVFGSAEDFFHRPEFLSRQATTPEIREFLALVGIAPATLKFPPR